MAFMKAVGVERAWRHLGSSSVSGAQGTVATVIAQATILSDQEKM